VRNFVEISLLLFTRSNVKGLDTPARCDTKKQTTSDRPLLAVERRTHHMQVQDKRDFANIVVLIESQLDNFGRIQMLEEIASILDVGVLLLGHLNVVLAITPLACRELVGVLLHPLECMLGVVKSYSSLPCLDGVGDLLGHLVHHVSMQPYTLAKSSLVVVVLRKLDVAPDLCLYT